MEPQVIYYIHQIKSESSWLDPTVITAFATVLIAIAALYISIQQAKQNIRHNRLSVKPHLQALHHYDEGRLRFFIENHGLGPAFFEKAEATLDGKPAPDGMYAIAWVLSEILPNYNITDARYDTISDGCAMPANSSLILFSYSCGEDESEVFLEELRSRALLTIKYKSAYNISEKFFIPGGHIG